MALMKEADMERSERGDRLATRQHVVQGKSPSHDGDQEILYSGTPEYDGRVLGNKLVDQLRADLNKKKF